MSPRRLTGEASSNLILKEDASCSVLIPEGTCSRVELKDGLRWSEGGAIVPSPVDSVSVSSVVGKRRIELAGDRVVVVVEACEEECVECVDRLDLRCRSIVLGDSSSADFMTTSTDGIAAVV